jgi:hypothetical protein
MISHRMPGCDCMPNAAQIFNDPTKKNHFTWCTLLVDGRKCLIRASCKEFVVFDLIKSGNKYGLFFECTFNR